MNFLEIVGASMGLHHDDHFKRLKMLQDAAAILADCRDLVEQHGLDVEATRQAIKAMLDEQPVRCVALPNATRHSLASHGADNREFDWRLAAAR
jgi:hypothetical protein